MHVKKTGSMVILITMQLSDGGFHTLALQPSSQYVTAAVLADVPCMFNGCDVMIGV